MKIRSQVSMVFHLDKCIGCHTCSVACKNIWTDRPGAEYMWWNNVETKPGTGYPTQWEDQEKYKGGWEIGNPGLPMLGKKDGLRLKLQNRLEGFANLFANPYMPTMDDYYEPWTYTYGDLINAPLGDDQPTARPISRVDGKPIEIEAGPNWDDDLGGSQVYAANDPLFENLSEAERQQLFEIERMIYFYVPRMCNHCLNPACVAACPSGAMYKRGEDGIVLVNQEKCRAWRMCVSACPYKKTYFNWSTGKSEKCILCYPRLETGQAPACFHSCVGRIRYLGVLLYDADRLEQAAKAPLNELVQRQRELILDPHDPGVVAEAKACGVPDGVIDSAQKSPVYQYVKEWEMALPLHPQFRTLPMLFYVPPLLPVLSASQETGTQRLAGDMFSSLESARLPVRYLASMLAAGNEELVISAYKKMIAVRLYKRAESVGDISAEQAQAALAEAGISPEVAEAIYRMTTVTTFSERFVIPPMGREVSVEALTDVQQHKGETGFGIRRPPKRGW
ncbi:MAG TPA: nitrate reductase subunit beta [Anaerolineales bacterium]|nr:nitrate reductase subunit beta [Anaerolineales bacterium]